MVLEKTLESPLDRKEIQPVHPKGDQSWVFIGQTDAKYSLEGLMLKLKLQYFGHLMQWVDSLEKTLMLGGIGGQEEKGTAEDAMAEWHHWLDGRESEWTPGVADGQGGLACCGSWGHKESDTTERLNWTNWPFVYVSWRNVYSDHLPIFKQLFDLLLLNFKNFLCIQDTAYL